MASSKKQTTPHTNLYLVGVLCIAILALVIVSVKFYKHTAKQQNPNTVTQYQTVPTTTITPSLSVPCIKTVEKLSDSYSCSTYSVMLPTGWFNTDSAEFTNYDQNTAAQRSYNAEMDKGKQKFVITITQTPQDLALFISKTMQANEYRIVSNTPITIGNYSAVKTVSTGPADNYKNPFTTVYIQNPSKTSIAEVSFIFGFENSITLQNQILSSFKFVK